MSLFQSKTPLEKEWNAMRSREIHFLKQYSIQKESLLNQLLADKVPEKLQITLNLAFEKAFSLIFENGTGVIDKTFRKGKMQDTYQINEFADSLKQNRKTLHSFTRKAKGSGQKNLILSGAAGIGMGLLGVGIPDIPVLTGMMLKSIYEIALSYGYDYESEKEQAYILMLIRGSISAGEELRRIDAQINQFILDEQLPDNYDRKSQIQETAGSLSKELLYMKFVQGIPVVGAVGGISDIVYMRRITEYARIKYCRRFLIQRKAIFEHNKKRNSHY